MYQRVGPSAFKKDLSNITLLLEQMGNPHKQLKCIHIAGTNGKGSTAHYMSSMLQEAGFKSGLYTSPHLRDFRERIRINGAMISKDDVLNFVNDHLHIIESILPSFFEITVAMAFWHFNEQQVDLAVIETGLGGRLDSTNVITPLLSVITNVSLDHTNMLGNTLELIATEKAGIIKENNLVLIGEHHEETDGIFMEKAKAMNCQIKFADQIEIPFMKFVENGLMGSYQLKNTKTAISALRMLSDKKNLGLTTANVKLGIRNVVSNTGIRGRWEVLNNEPITIADIAHNAAGLTEVMRVIGSMEYNQFHCVLGVVNDKELNSILKLFPKNGSYYFCKPNVPRGLDVEELSEQAKQVGLMGKCYPSVMEAYNAAKHHAKQEDLIYIGGSTFVVAEVI